MKASSCDYADTYLSCMVEITVPVRVKVRIDPTQSTEQQLARIREHIETRFSKPTPNAKMWVESSTPMVGNYVMEWTDYVPYVTVWVA